MEIIKKKFMQSFTICAITCLSLSFSACARTKDKAAENSKYVQLLNEYDAFGLYKISHWSVCKKAKEQKQEVQSICSANLDAVPVALINEKILPEIKRKIDPQYLDALIVHYSSPIVKHINKRISFHGLEVKDSEYLYVTSGCSPEECEQMTMLDDWYLFDIIDPLVITYIKENKIAPLGQADLDAIDVKLEALTLSAVP